jgi:beta-1,4-mannooligosaccharide/beta-1,4-mannosyl-N-acetylglucosamine phosphorylase
MYSMGCMLLDLEDPSRIVGKMRACLMWPEEPYEMNGNCPMVVFPTAAIVHGKPDELKIYYGAADRTMCLARASLSSLIEQCLADGPVEYVYRQ